MDNECDILRFGERLERESAEPEPEPMPEDAFDVLRDGERLNGRSPITRRIDCPDDPPERRPVERYTLAQLREQYPRLNPPVVDGLFRAGETVNLVSTSKVGKSWLAYHLALSIITGEPWLGRFPTAAGRVLLIDNELHRGTLAHRVPTVGDALGLRRQEYEHDIEIWPLRGDLRSLPELGPDIDAIEPGTFRAIVLDAKYRFATAGKSENDNAAEALAYNLLDQYAEQTGAAIVLIHHASKGTQSEKRVTDVGAGAGAQSRACDCHLILREHEEPGCVVLDAAVRSFAPVEPVTLKWTFPLWTPTDLDPGLLKGRLTRAEQRQDDKDREGMLTMVDILRQWDDDQDGPPTPNKIKEKSPFGATRTRTLLAKLLHAGDVTRYPIVIRGNQSHQYRLAVD